MPVRVTTNGQDTIEASLLNLSLATAQEKKHSRFRRENFDPIIHEVDELTAERKYREAAKLLLAHPNAKSDALKAKIARLMRFVRESEKGEYDLKRLFHETVTSTNDPSLDHADFVGPFAKRWISESKGFGLVATRDIPAGELLIASKAFAASFSKISPDAADTVSDDKEDRALQAKTFDRLAESDEDAKEFFALSGGPEYPRSAEDRALGSERLDRRRIASILKYNSWPIDLLEIPGSGGKYYDLDGRGVWILPAFINHSCVPNCKRASFGDMMLIRAITEIAKDEELTLAYVSLEENFVDRQAKLFARYDIECVCALCEKDRLNREMHETLDKRREAFLKQFDVKLSALSLFVPPSQLTHFVVKSCCSFEALAYKNRFDPGLAQLYSHLGMLQLRKRLAFIGIGPIPEQNRDPDSAEHELEQATECVARDFNKRGWMALLGDGNPSFVRAPNVLVMGQLVRILCGFAGTPDLLRCEAPRCVELFLECVRVENGTTDLDLLQLLFPSDEVRIAVDIVRKIQDLQKQNEPAIVRAVGGAEATSKSNG